MKMNALIMLLTLAAGCGKEDDKPARVPVRMSIEDISTIEGSSGTKQVELRVRLDNAPTGTVTVRYNTADGTALATDDYTAVANGTLSFSAGETEKKIGISIVADEFREPEEQFTVTLSGPVGATISKTAGTVTIVNDDTKINFGNTGYDAPTTYPGYTLAWSDEFNTNTLNSTIWKHQNGDGCPNLCGWGNNELEYYTDRPDNLFFQDGKLIIEAKKENFGGRQYTSSKILTEGKKSFKFGRIDIRAKLPKGKGIWPAFWLLPQNNVFGGWPRSGEIDLMELVGHQPNKSYGTIHYGPGPGSTQISRGYTLPGNATFNDEFHVFSLEWKQDQIKWYVDGNLFSTVNKADLGALNYPFNEDFYLIFNLAVGGNWPGNPDANTTFPQWLIVDYVRVYQ